MYVRPYEVESAIEPGCGVVQGADENKVKAPGAGGSGDFVGAYGFRSNDPKQASDHVGIVVYGGPVKVLAGGTVSPGKKAVLKADTSGSFVECPSVAGNYKTVGLFLESGADGEYVDMIVERDAVHIPI